ncbi:MAG: DNA-J related domain-containing protein [Thalassotalea sp.]|nr:DNA-J related domain-containing protein [Thalassotalea sp.]
MPQHKLLTALEKILPQHSLGISEYNLIQILQKPPYQVFIKGGMSDPLILFQTHFILFNALYQLKDLWQAEQKANLDILVTHIRFLPYQKGPVALSKEDKLRTYYLDWQNFTDTNKQDVELLIESFWDFMAEDIKSIPQTPAVIKNAFECLLLNEDADFSQVKRQYRKLLHQYHPDKGGETIKAQQIEEAFNVLKKHLSCTTGR